MALRDNVQLQDELERQHERMREVQLETAKRIAEERSNADRRYTYQVDDARIINQSTKNENFLTG